MMEKKKILLPSEDIITRGSEDLYINVNLDQTYTEIKRFKYDNTFDIAKMFEDEKNSSRNFFIYGTVDSVFTDCDELELDVYFPVNNIGTQNQNAGVSFIRDREIIELTDGTMLKYYDTIVTNNLAYGKGNVFGKKKGEYQLLLENFDRDYAYIAYAKAKRTMLNRNSLFSNGLTDWLTSSIDAQAPRWIPDTNKRRVYVKNNGITTNSALLRPNRPDPFSEVPTEYKFTVDVLAKTKFPITVIFTSVFNNGDPFHTLDTIKVAPNDSNITIYTEENSYPTLASAVVNNVAVSIQFDPEEPVGSTVYLDRYQIKRSENQLDLTGRIQNASFNQGLSYWEEGAGTSSWEHIPTENAIFSRKNEPVGTVGTPRLLTQEFHFKRGIDYNLIFEFQQSTPPEKMSILLYMGDAGNLKQELIYRPAVDGPLTPPTNSINFTPTKDYSTFTTQVLIAADRDPQDFINLDAISITPRVQIIGDQDAVVEEVQLFKNQLVFTDDDGALIKYGSETLDISEDGSIDVVENDFPFFYNTHWIKNNIEITRNITRIMSFDSDAFSIETGEVTTVSVSLNKPSALGVEKASVVIFSDDATEDVDYTYFPKTIQWNKGEVSKEITIQTLSSDFSPTTKNLFLTVSQVVRAEVNPSKSGVNIEVADANVSRFTTISIPRVFNNLKSFGNRIVSNNDTQELEQIARPSIFRNGGEFDGIPEEFYPTDQFTLTITNNGEIVAYDPIPGISETEFTLGFGESIVASVGANFAGNSPLNTYTITVNKPAEAVSGALDINGHIYLNIDTITDLIEAVQSDASDKSFTLSTVGNTSVEIASTTPGVPVNITKFDPSSIITINEDHPYTFLEQTPLSFRLKANRGGQRVDYEIKLEKEGFESITVNTGELAAKEINPDVYFLVTSYSDISSFLEDGECLQADGVGIRNDIVFNGALFIADNVDESNDRLNETTFGSDVEGEPYKFLRSPSAVVGCTEQNNVKIGPYNNNFVSG